MLLRRYSILFLLAAVLISAAVPVAAVCREENFVRVPQSIQTFTGDETYIYYGTLTGKLQRADKNTKAITTLASIGGKIEEMTLDATTIYFSVPLLQADESTRTTIYALPKTGGTPTKLVEVNDLVGTMRVDATTLYWIVRSKGFSDATGKIQKMAKVGGSISTLAQNLAVPIDLYVDSDAIYFTEDGLTHTPPYGLSRVGKNGGTVQKLNGTHPGFEILSVEGGNVIYTVWEDEDHQGIYRIASTGGTPVSIRSGLYVPSHFEKSGDKIYFSAARYDLSNGEQGTLQVFEPSGNVVTLYPNPVRTFVSDSQAIYAMPGVNATGRIDRFCLNYATAPRITSFSGNGALIGGTPITVVGERFASGARVTFDGIDATIVSITPTQIQLTIPPHTQGIVDVYVINPNGESGRGSFYYDPSIGNETHRQRAIRR